jgi:hypothetical protein
MKAAMALFALGSVLAAWQQASAHTPAIAAIWAPRQLLTASDWQLCFWCHHMKLPNEMSAVHLPAGLCNCDEGVIDALACQAPRCLQQLSGRALKHHACLAKAPQPAAAAASQLLAALRAAAEALLVIGRHGDGKAQLREAECIPGTRNDEVCAGCAAFAITACSILKYVHPFAPAVACAPHAVLGGMLGLAAEQLADLAIIAFKGLSSHASF